MFESLLDFIYYNISLPDYKNLKGYGNHEMHVNHHFTAIFRDG